MKIFVDFDDVIFNAGKFKADLVEIFLKNGVTKNEFENSYYSHSDKSQSGGKIYNPQEQIAALRRKNKIDYQQLIREVDSFMKNLEEYVFSDTEEFLKNFSQKDLFLLTYGHEKFQKEKINGSGVASYFGEIMISQNNKLDEILETKEKYEFEKGERLILIDDRPEQLARDEERKKSIITFRMRREEGRYSDLICNDRDYEVKNFKEALEIIESSFRKKMKHEK